MAEKRPFWLDMDGGDTIQFSDQVYRVEASGAQTGGLFGLVEVSTPQGSGPPPHVHEREDEAFHVLKLCGWETFFHDVVRATGGAAPAPAVVAELAKERGVTLLGPPPAP
jgi:hypothetical protein